MYIAALLTTEQMHADSTQSLLAYFLKNMI